MFDRRYIPAPRQRVNIYMPVEVLLQFMFNRIRDFSLLLRDER